MKKNLWRIVGFLEVRRKGTGGNFFKARIGRMGGRVVSRYEERSHKQKGNAWLELHNPDFPSLLDSSIFPANVITR